ncbi:hypothetical protein [Carboxylicivirga linearis]|uniref:DUF3278 domain-containing protein n=1 Tax=Carboxylicivirga linearis TaxID=1628157 RepID=A0ABS5K1Y3_9BACT|nr:hypothetical protein [Carboxylicivirga linearis]MBS2101143.1 hypothetical protein [Carboxylicivirga linearis]
MKNDILSQTWNSQKSDSVIASPDQIIKKANKQRNSQYISIAVMSVTVVILLTYAIYYVGNNWNTFTLGMILMISSLTFRIALEFLSIYKKEHQLISLDNHSFKKYLKKHYQIRLKVNYIITPVCFAIYTFGFTLLLPYFKQMFSRGFYLYIVISGVVSLVVIAVIIVNTIRKEHSFLNSLNKNNGSNKTK